MHESFSIVLSDAGVLIALGIPFLFTALLWALARLVPPAAPEPGVAAGVSGLLLVIVFCMCVSAAVQLFYVWADSFEVVRIISTDSSFAWPAVKTLLPGIAAAGAEILAVLLLVFGRSRLTLWLALLGLWIAGPGADVLKSLILGIPFDAHSGFFGVSIFTIVATLYLLFSRRSASTYGLSRAAKKRAL